MALFTLLHMSELIEGFNPVQLFIMPMMFVIALLMAIDSVKVCKGQGIARPKGAESPQNVSSALSASGRHNCA